MRKARYLLLFALLGSCAPSAMIPGMVPTAPRQSASGVVAAQSVRSATQGAAVISARLEGQVTALATQSTSLRAGMQAALAEADRLRQQKTASEAELVGMWNQLAELTQRNLFLETETAAALTTANEQKTSREALEKTVNAMTVTAMDNASEIDALRAQRTDLAATVNRTNSDLMKITAAKDAAEKKAAVGSYLKGCLWFAAICLILFLAAKMLLTLYAPRLP